MIQVQTIRGLIDIDRLEIKDEVILEDNARIITTEWNLNGEIVKRDAHVALLRGQSLSAKSQQI